MRLRNFGKLALVAIGLAYGCVEPYEPPTQKSITDFLVVDGYLDAGNGTATITIFHSVPLNSSASPLPETNADVTITDDQNNSVRLLADGTGGYFADGVNYDFNRTYELKIRTTDSDEYKSDPITLKRSPSIDSITWDVRNEALNIRVNTHDASGQSKYYKWDFIETYEYTSPNNSRYILLPGGAVVTRPEDESIYICYKTDPSTVINVATSTRLSEDIISEKILKTIDGTSILLSRNYSILVQQRTLSEEEYDYWLNVKKTTESLGGLFDPLPSEVIGNIHAVNGDKVVIGFIAGGQRTEKRIFINRNELRDVFPEFRFNIGCEPDTVLLNNLQFLQYRDGITNPVTGGGPPALIGYLYKDSPSCNDCRVFGDGITEKPAFWNN